MARIQVRNHRAGTAVVDDVQLSSGVLDQLIEHHLPSRSDGIVAYVHRLLFGQRYQLLDCLGWKVLVRRRHYRTHANRGDGQEVLVGVDRWLLDEHGHLGHDALQGHQQRRAVWR